VQYIEAPKVVGVYAQLERDAYVRVVTDAEFAFEDGDERPTGKYNQLRWQWNEFRTFRRDYPFMLGWQAQEQAGGGWKPLAAHAEMVTMQAMTNRTNRIATLLQTSGNWPATNVASVGSLAPGGGFWKNASDDPSNPAYNTIQRSLMAAVRKINLLTNSAVSFADLKLVVSPDLAIDMATSPEIKNYIRESPVALAEVKGDLSNYNLQWGLPVTVYSLPIVVEDASIVTSRPLAAGTEATADVDRVYCFSKTSAVLASRVGGLDGIYGSPSFSTIQLYHHGGLLRVLTFDDSRNERTDGHVEENFKEVLAAGVAGFLITGTA
jgi:hypothetical protein